MKGNLRWSKILEENNEISLIEFITLATQKETLKLAFLEYWAKEKFDILLTPVLPYPAIKHGDGAKLYNTIGLVNY